MELKIRRLTMEYPAPGVARPPLEQLDVRARAGELVLALGPSGCGKTELLSWLAGQRQPAAGHVVVDGQDLGALDEATLARYRRETAAMVPQRLELAADRTAREYVVSALLDTGWKDESAQHRAGQLIAELGLDQVSDKPTLELSDGERIRVALARALTGDPALILVDEPTSRLDYIEVEEVLSLLRRLAGAGRIVIVASRDGMLRSIADRVIDLTPSGGADEEGPLSVSLAAGELLFSQGDPSDFVYVVERGVVELFQPREDGSEQLRALVGAGEYFGELGPMLSLPRSASARATETTVLTAYGPRAFRAFRTAHPGASPRGPIDAGPLAPVAEPTQ